VPSTGGFSTGAFVPSTGGCSTGGFWPRVERPRGFMPGVTGPRLLGRNVRGPTSVIRVGMLVIRVGGLGCSPGNMLVFGFGLHAPR
jgi:hypothetical protein